MKQTQLGSVVVIDGGWAGSVGSAFWFVLWFSSLELKDMRSRERYCFAGVSIRTKPRDVSADQDRVKGQEEHNTSEVSFFF